MTFKLELSIEVEDEPDDVEELPRSLAARSSRSSRTATDAALEVQWVQATPATAEDRHGAEDASSPSSLSIGAAAFRTMTIAARRFSRRKAEPNEVAEHLAKTQNAAHRYRLKVSGSVLAIGSIVFASSQSVLILHGHGFEVLGAYGPAIGGTGNLLGQGVMLLALQPSDKWLSILAATLLILFCVYMVRKARLRVACGARACGRPFERLCAALLAGVLLPVPHHRPDDGGRRLGGRGVARVRLPAA